MNCCACSSLRVCRPRRSRNSCRRIPAIHRQCSRTCASSTASSRSRRRSCRWTRLFHREAHPTAGSSPARAARAASRCSPTIRTLGSPRRASGISRICTRRASMPSVPRCPESPASSSAAISTLRGRRPIPDPMCRTCIWRSSTAPAATSVPRDRAFSSCCAKPSRSKAPTTNR